MPRDDFPYPHSEAGPRKQPLFGLAAIAVSWLIVMLVAVGAFLAIDSHLTQACIDRHTAAGAQPSEKTKQICGGKQ